MAVTLSNLNQNQNSFTVRLRYKFAVKPTTLPCVICLQEITMLKNCVNKLPPTTQTAMQYSATDYSSKKYSNKTLKLLNLLAGVPQTTGPISAASGLKFTILWGHLEDIVLLNKFFFRLSIRALFAKI